MKKIKWRSVWRKKSPNYCRCAESLSETERAGYDLAFTIETIDVRNVAKGSQQKAFSPIRAFFATWQKHRLPRRYRATIEQCCVLCGRLVWYSATFEHQSTVDSSMPFILDRSREREALVYPIPKRDKIAYTSLLQSPELFSSAIQQKEIFFIPSRTSCVIFMSPGDSASLPLPFYGSGHQMRTGFSGRSLFHCHGRISPLSSAFPP